MKNERHKRYLKPKTVTMLCLLLLPLMLFYLWVLMTFSPSDVPFLSKETTRPSAKSAPLLVSKGDLRRSPSHSARDSEVFSDNLRPVIPLNSQQETKTEINGKPCPILVDSRARVSLENLKGFISPLIKDVTLIRFTCYVKLHGKLCHISDKTLLDYLYRSCC